MTQEDWNEVLYNGMEKTSPLASLYFIALMTFGNYVLFNLLVAILVEGFSTEDEPKKIEDRIRADALQAIVNQEAAAAVTRKHTRRQSSGHASSNASKRNNFGTSNGQRTPSKRSTSQKERPKAKRPVDSIDSEIPKPTLVNVEYQQQLQHVSTDLPIIIHTCPTPAQTPPASLSTERGGSAGGRRRGTLTRQAAHRDSRSSRNYSFFKPNSHYKILFNTNIVRDNNNNNNNDDDSYEYFHVKKRRRSANADRFSRKFSLDCSSVILDSKQNRAKVSLKIYDRKSLCFQLLWKKAPTNVRRFYR